MRSVRTLTKNFFLLFLRKVLFSILKSTFCNLENYSLLRKKRNFSTFEKRTFSTLVKSNFSTFKKKTLFY